MTMSNDEIIGDGNTPSALTDLRDIGHYVAKIISDERTLNKMVFAYDVVLTQNEIYDMLEKISGEQIERKHVSVKPLESTHLEHVLTASDRSLRKKFSTESPRPALRVRHTRTTLPSTFHDTSPSTSCRGVSVETTSPSTPSTWVT